MGIETEYGISVPGQPDANPMLASSQVVNAYAAATQPGAPRPLGLRGGEPAARRARLRPGPRGRRLQPAHRRGPRPGQRHPDQRRAALRRPRAPGVLHARGAPTRATPCCWDKAGERVMAEAARRAAADARRSRRSRSTRTTPTTRAPPTARHENYLMSRGDAVRGHRPPPDAVLRHAARSSTGAGPGRHRPGRPRRTASRSASGPTTSRSRSAWRRRSSARSSTPATSRTPTPRSTAGCT